MAVLEDAVKTLSAATASLPDCISKLVGADAIEGCPDPHVDVRTCGAYPDLDTGTVLGSGTSIGSVRLLSCDNSYALNGMGSRRVQVVCACVRVFVCSRVTCLVTIFFVSLRRCQKP